MHVNALALETDQDVDRVAAARGADGVAVVEAGSGS
jgi:hypothetical protein